MGRHCIPSWSLWCFRQGLRCFIKNTTFSAERCGSPDKSKLFKGTTLPSSQTVTNCFVTVRPQDTCAALSVCAFEQPKKTQYRLQQFANKTVPISLHTWRCCNGSFCQICLWGWLMACFHVVLFTAFNRDVERSQPYRVCVLPSLHR